MFWKRKKAHADAPTKDEPVKKDKPCPFTAANKALEALKPDECGVCGSASFGIDMRHWLLYSSFMFYRPRTRVHWGCETCGTVVAGKVSDDLTLGTVEYIGYSDGHDRRECQCCAVCTSIDDGICTRLPTHVEIADPYKHKCGFFDHRRSDKPDTKAFKEEG